MVINGFDASFRPIDIFGYIIYIMVNRIPMPYSKE